MLYTYQKPKNKIGIHSKATFIAALKGQSVLGILSFKKFLTDAENLVRAENPNVTQGALNNVRGSWYEWLIALGFIEYRVINPNSNLLLQLPNIKRYNCAKLYEPEIYDLIQDLKQKVLDSAAVSLITSNPDFVILDNDLNIALPNIVTGNVVAENLDELCQTYLLAEHLCKLDHVLGYAAVKSSLRPDRRLQVPHEGSLMKAIYKHVQTRQWLIDAPGVKYYAIAGKINKTDTAALKTVATHSVIDVGSKPQPAVDQLFCVESGATLQQIFDQIL